MNMRIVFLGRTQMLMRAIELFENSQHTIAGIGTCAAVAEYFVNESDFENKANELGVPFFCSVRINSQEVREILISMKADIAISVNWLTIIQKETMNLFPFGILNGHAGDLPRYRGNACPNWAIINGEEKIGLSVHFMESGSLDSGDIVIKKFVDINKNTTIGEIYEQMETLFPKMFLQAVEKIEQMGKAAGTPQGKKREQVLRCYPRIPSDSCIDWNKDCMEIERLIRASGFPFQGAYTFLNGKEKIYIQKADIAEYEFPSLAVCGQVVVRDCENDCVGIAAKDGVILIRQLCDEDHEPCRVTGKIRSMRDRMGMDVPDKIYELMREIELLKTRLGNHEQKQQDIFNV